MPLIDEHADRQEPIRSEPRSVPIDIAIAAIPIVPIGAIDFVTGKKSFIRGHREPADITSSGPVYDPGRRPDIARNPKPAVVRIINPTAIVEGNVAPDIVCGPHPAESIRVIPVPATIGAKIAFYPCWLPHI